jgi:hypothetical protein
MKEQKKRKIKTIQGVIFLESEASSAAMTSHGPILCGSKIFFNKRISRPIMTIFNKNIVSRVKTHRHEY